MLLRLLFLASNSEGKINYNRIPYGNEYLSHFLIGFSFPLDSHCNGKFSPNLEPNFALEAAQIKIDLQDDDENCYLVFTTLPNGCGRLRKISLECLGWSAGQRKLNCYFFLTLSETNPVRTFLNARDLQSMISLCSRCWVLCLITRQ